MFTPPRSNSLGVLLLAATFACTARAVGTTQAAYGLNRTLTPGDLVCGGGASQVVGQPLGLLQGPEGSTIYLSFLLSASKSPQDGSYFGIWLGGENNTLFIGKPGAGASDQYVVETFGGSGQESSGVDATSGATAFIVVKIQLAPGNDVITLYVNPVVNGNSEPRNGTIKSDLDLGTLSAIYSVSSDAYSCVDQVRVGTSFQAVTSQ